MTEAQAEEAVLQFWRAGWDLLHAEAGPDPVPWQTENTVDESLIEFIRISLTPTARSNMTLPSQRKAQLGYIAVQIFTRANTGTLRSNVLADHVRAVLENKSIYAPGVDEPVCTYAGAGDRPSTDGQWQMKLVRVVFRYDDVSGPAAP